MPKLSDMEVCTLRLKCVEAFIVVASRMDIDQEKVFEKGEKLYLFCIKGLPTETKKNPMDK